MKNLSLSLLLGCIFILFATTTHAQTPPEQATNFQINATHTGSISVEDLTPPLKQRWVVNFGRAMSYPLIADGKVFVTVRNASLHGTVLFALNATDGSTAWSSPLGGDFWWSAACYENGRVFALNGSGVLRAFDGATGAVIWTLQLGSGFSIFDSAPTAYQGVIYVSGGGSVFAVNATSGSVLWTTSVINGDTSSPAVTSDGVWVSYSCPNVYRLDPATGATVWHHGNGCSGGGGKTPVEYNGRLYVRDFTDMIFDSQTGTVLGNFISKHTPAFSGSRGFFLNGPGGFGSFGTLEARDVNTHSLLWSFAGDGRLQSAVLVVNDYVYVGSESGQLYAVHAATGQQVWAANAGASIPYVDEQNVSQPITSFAAGEGLLVVPTSTTLVAYERDVDSTPPVTQAFVSGTAGTNGWFRSAVQITLSATDNFSGVQSTSYRVDGGATQTYSGPFVISAMGQHTVEYWSVDSLGNTETTKSLQVKIDAVAPVVTATANPSTAPKKPQPVSVTISGNASDALSGIGGASFNVIDEYGVAQPSGPVTLQANGNYSFTLSLPATKQGSDKNGHLYTIVVTATDQAGNSTSVTRTLTIN